jgi:HEPN domain-containing protein
MKEEVKNWLKKAEEDLDAAKYNFEGAKLEVAAFLCQQAAEKALKALYIKNFESLLKVHDLVLLSKKLDAPKQIVEICKTLTSFYIETRYPSFLDAGVSEKEVISALKDSQKVIEWIKEKL